MTMSWRRCTQPENVISRNASSGGMGPMPGVYRGRRPIFWTARETIRVLDADAIALTISAELEHPKAIRSKVLLHDEMLGSRSDPGTDVSFGVRVTCPLSRKTGGSPADASSAADDPLR